MSKFVVRYLSETEYPEWDLFVDESEHGTIFHKSNWNLAVCNGEPGVNVSVIACFNQDNKLVAGAILCWKKVFGRFKIVFAPYATTYSGILIKERDSEYLSKRESFRFNLLSELLEFIEKQFHSISMALPPSFQDVRIFNWRNYSSRIFYTYVGDLTKKEDLINGFLPAIRRQIKKAESIESEVTFNKEKEHFETVYSLISKSYKRQSHQFRFSKEQFFSILNKPEFDKNISIYSISDKNIPVASIVLLVDKDTAYYWLAGGDHTKFNTGLNQLLLWDVLQRVSKEGIKYFDFIGANTASITNYKSGYNFNLKSYYYVTKEIGRTIRFLFKLKNTIKRKKT